MYPHQVKLRLTVNLVHDNTMSFLLITPLEKVGKQAAGFIWSLQKAIKMGISTGL
jgi:hypothetical protein